MHDSKKIVLLGHPRVGKTALTVQLVDKRFVEKHEATIEDSYQHWQMVDGQECRLEILDTGGEERYADLREKQLKEGQGFLLCFSITDRSSFYSIRRYFQDVIRARSGDDSHSAPTAPGSALHSALNSARAHSVASTTATVRNLSEASDQAAANYLLSAGAGTGSLHARDSDPPLFTDEISSLAHLQESLQTGLVLVGLKGDAWSSRAVSIDEIELLSRELGLHYFEIDTQQHAQVVGVIQAIVRKCRKVNEPDCVCGAAEANAKSKKTRGAAGSSSSSSSSTRSRICVCQDICAQCQHWRMLHTDPKHKFVPQALPANVTSCCTIQ